jgi:hypothetical protein
MSRIYDPAEEWRQRLARAVDEYDSTNPPAAGASPYDQRWRDRIADFLMGDDGPVYDPAQEWRQRLAQAVEEYDSTNPPAAEASPYDQRWRDRIADFLDGRTGGSDPLEHVAPPPQPMMDQGVARDFYDRVGMPTPSWSETAVDMAKSGGVGLGKAAIGALGMPGDIGELGSAATDYLGRKLGVSPERIAQFKQIMRYSPHLAPFRQLSSKDITGAVKYFTGEFYEPQTTAGTITERVAEFAGGLAMPGGPVRRVVGGVIAPMVGSELAGRIPGVEGTSLEGPARSAGALTGLVAGAARMPGRAASAVDDLGGVARQTRHGSSGPQAFESKHSIFDPPSKPIRPFEADYPKTPRTDASGRLLEDIEGRKLIAKYIVGRRTLGGPDEPLTPAQRAEVIKALSGSRARKVGPEELPEKALGMYDSRPESPSFREIRVLNTLDPVTRNRVLGHETGHLLHQFNGRVAPTRGPDGVPQELLTVYNDLNNFALNAARGHGLDPVPPSFPAFWGFDPAKRGYRDPETILSELFAEGNRAYQNSPNYIKSVAPNVAAAIRELVNTDPVLSKTIQFNTLAGGTVSAAALAEAIRNYRREDADGF